MIEKKEVSMHRWLSWKKEKASSLLGVDLRNVRVHRLRNNSSIPLCFLSVRIVKYMDRLPLCDQRPRDSDPAAPDHEARGKVLNTFLLLPIIFSAVLAAVSFLIAELSTGAFLDWELFMVGNYLR